jgi:transposase
MFDLQVAWLATHVSKSAAGDLMRIAWSTVGSIVKRYWADVERRVDLFDGLRRIGIDEISYKRGHKYVMVVVDHDTGRLVWMGEGRSVKTLGEFFDALGPERAKLITHVSADGAQFIADAVGRWCPQAVLCADPFHVVKWAGRAVDDVRRGAWNRARQQAKHVNEYRGRGRPANDAPPRVHTEKIRRLKGARWALLKNPENLTVKQQAKLEWVHATDPKLYRAYQLKEGLRYVFKATTREEAEDLLTRWVSWARRSRIDEFVKLQRTIMAYKDTILASIEHHMSNGLVESVNTKIRLITRMAYGFKSTDALISLAMLNLGGHKPPLPAR